MYFFEKDEYLASTDRWVQVTPGITLVKLHIFYTVDF